MCALYFLLHLFQDPLFHPRYLYLGNTHLFCDHTLCLFLKIPLIDQFPLFTLQFSQDFFQKQAVQHPLTLIFFFFQLIQQKDRVSLPLIEIRIPMEQYQNKDKVDFITNPDGTISVLIKNVGSIISK